MDHDEIYRRAREAEKAQAGKKRKEKRAAREKKFWRAFLFTEDGKPKSGLGVYTFCMSFVFLALYIVSFMLLLDPLEPLLTRISLPFLSNLIGSLICSLVVLLPCWLIHRFAKDKRLMFGTYLWLGGYGIVVLIAELILLRSDSEAILHFLSFFGWFMLVPLLTGIPFTYLLCRRDHKPQAASTEPEWKKYVNRR